MDPKQEVAELLEQARVRDCYQCGKCTAGCPVADRMDITPNVVFRLAQTGDIERAAKSEAIWQCVSCQTCGTRCPKSVDCLMVLDALRLFADRNGLASAGRRRVLLFYRAFLDVIRRHGRIAEVELIGQFKTMSFLRDLNPVLLMKDATLAPALMKRRKFHLLGERVRDRSVVTRIFERCAR